MSILRPETVSAVSAEPEYIKIGGTDIITAPDKKITCGDGEVRYDAENNTLTLDRAVIDYAAGYGIEIQKAGVTIKLAGQNRISAAGGMISTSHAVRIEGEEEGSKLTIEAKAGDGIRAPGLEIFRAEIDIQAAKVGSEGGARGIVISHGQGRIEESKICIRVLDEAVGVAIGEAEALVVKGSEIDIEQSAMGIDVDGLTVSGSQIGINASQSGIVCSREKLAIKDSAVAVRTTGEVDAVSARKGMEITDSAFDLQAAGSGIRCYYGGFTASGSELSVKSAKTALNVRESQSCSISSSEVTLESAEESAVMADAKELRITGSKLTASSAGSSEAALYVSGGGNLIIEDSSGSPSEVRITTENAYGIFCEGDITVTGSKAEITAQRTGIQAGGAVGLEESKVAVEAGNTGIRAGGAVNLKNSDVAAKAEENSIQAGSDITIDGGTTETGGGKICTDGEGATVTVTEDGKVTSGGELDYSGITGESGKIGRAHV